MRVCPLPSPPLPPVPPPVSLSRNENAVVPFSVFLSLSLPPRRMRARDSRRDHVTQGRCRLFVSICFPGLALRMSRAWLCTHTHTHTHIKGQATTRTSALSYMCMYVYVGMCPICALSVPYLCPQRSRICMWHVHIMQMHTRMCANVNLRVT